MRPAEKSWRTPQRVRWRKRWQWEDVTPCLTSAKAADASGALDSGAQCHLPKCATLSSQSLASTTAASNLCGIARRRRSFWSRVPLLQGARSRCATRQHLRRARRASFRYFNREQVPDRTLRHAVARSTEGVSHTARGALSHPIVLPDRLRRCSPTTEGNSEALALLRCRKIATAKAGCAQSTAFMFLRLCLGREAAVNAQGSLVQSTRHCAICYRCWQPWRKKSQRHWQLRCAKVTKSVATR